MNRAHTFTVLVPLGFALAACAAPKTSAHVPPQPVSLTSASVEAHSDAYKVAPDLADSPDPVDASIAEWAERYPDAARGLADWARDNGDAAAKLSAWGAQYPERMQVLGLWAVTHPYEELGSFFMTRTGWDDFQKLRAQEKAAISDFIEWCRTSPPAAAELARHPGGLAYLDEHAFAPARRAMRSPHKAKAGSPDKPDKSVTPRR